MGLALFGAMYISIFPQLSEQMAQISHIPIYQAMGMEIGSFEGYIASVVLQFVPLLLGIYAIITSTKTLSGEEDSGTLELVMAKPLSRWQILTAKTVAIAIALFVILAVAGLGNGLVLGAIKATTDVAVSPTQLWASVLGAWPITMAFVSFGLFLGAFLPSRRIAAIAATVVFIASYFGENLTGMVESLEPIKPLSLFSYFDSTAAVFIDGAQAGDILLLLGVTVVFFALALVGFQRRNVTVRAWPWQRARIKG
jgi:ABC-2 type transport system permease protein